MHVSFHDQVTVGVNVFDTINACDALFPLLRDNARVVTVSSMVNRFTWPHLSDAVKAEFNDPALTMDGQFYVKPFFSIVIL